MVAKIRMGCAPQSRQFQGGNQSSYVPPNVPSTPERNVMSRPPTSSPLAPAPLSLASTRLPLPPASPQAPPVPDSPSRRFFIQDPRTYGTLSPGGNPRMLEVDYATYIASQHMQKSSPVALRADDIPPPTQHMELSPGLLYTQGAAAARPEKGKKESASKAAVLKVPNVLKVPEKTSEALKWYQKQMAQRRYMGLQTAKDVGTFVAKKLKVSAPTAKVGRQAVGKPGQRARQLVTSHTHTNPTTSRLRQASSARTRLSRKSSSRWTTPTWPSWASPTPTTARRSSSEPMRS